MKKRSKNYKAADKKKTVSAEAMNITSAINAVKASSYTKFTGGIDLHVKLFTPTKKDNMSMKGSVSFPNSTGKSVNIVVFTADPKKEELAKKLGALDAGAESLVKKVQEGFTAFDIAIAEPAMMPKIAILGKVLGPKGAMPNPKNGTVTDDIETAIKQYQSGKTDFSIDKDYVVHLSVGKTDMETSKLVENITAAIKAILSVTGKSLPASIVNVYVAPTMGKAQEIDKNTLA
ncbi:50S ribosomal protein L1 [Candidatus Dojkabacteria bacterium]|nr:50S ribosomal protein L1 [Candidatus Dojkabacteria bacterium]